MVIKIIGVSRKSSKGHRHKDGGNWQVNSNKKCTQPLKRKLGHKKSKDRKSLQFILILINFVFGSSLTAPKVIEIFKPFHHTKLLGSRGGELEAISSLILSGI